MKYYPYRNKMAIMMEIIASFFCIRPILFSIYIHVAGWLKIQKLYFQLQTFQMWKFLFNLKVSPTPRTGKKSLINENFYWDDVIRNPDKLSNVRFFTFWIIISEQILIMHLTVNGRWPCIAFQNLWQVNGWTTKVRVRA